MKSSRWLRFLPHAWFLAFLCIYLSGLAGSFLADDSPETIAAMAALEPQHPPGYPFLTLLGRLALLVPLGGPSFRICLLAAVAAALAAVVAGLLARDSARRLAVDEAGAAAAGTMAAAILALSRTFWMTALSAKGAVYSVNVLLLGLVLRELVMPPGGGDSRRGPASTALLFGAGLAHHWMSFAAALPGIAVLLSGRPRKGGAGKAAAVAAFFVIAGVSAYLFLPVRAATLLRLNWGRPDSLDRFASVVTREQYREVETAERISGYWGLRTVHLGSFFAREWPLWLWAAAVPGIAAMSTGLPRALSGLLLTAGMVLGGAFVIANPLPDRVFTTEPYLTPALFVFAVLFGLGLAWAGAKWAKLSAGRWMAAAALAAAWILMRGYRAHDLSRYYLSYDYGVNLLAGIPRGAVVFCEGDYDLFSLFYLDQVARQRPDVTPVAAIFLDYDWYRTTAHRILPDVIPLEHERGQIVVRPSRPLVYTSQHGGGEGVLKPVGLTMRPPLWGGHGIADSLRAWRAQRMRGVWRLFGNPPGMERDLLDSYGLQMARLAGDAEGENPRKAEALYAKAFLLPMEAGTEIRSRLRFARLLLSLGKKGAAREEAARVMELAPGSLDVLVRAAELFRASGDRETARRLLWKALMAVPPQGMEAQRSELLRMLSELD